MCYTYVGAHCIVLYICVSICVSIQWLCLCLAAYGRSCPCEGQRLAAPLTRARARGVLGRGRVGAASPTSPTRKKETLTTGDTTATPKGARYVPAVPRNAKA